MPPPDQEGPGDGGYLDRGDVAFDRRHRTVHRILWVLRFRVFCGALQRHELPWEQNVAKHELGDLEEELDLGSCSVAASSRVPRVVARSPEHELELISMEDPDRFHKMIKVLESRRATQPGHREGHRQDGDAKRATRLVPVAANLRVETSVLDTSVLLLSPLPGEHVLVCDGLSQDRYSAPKGSRPNHRSAREMPLGL